MNLSRRAFVGAAAGCLMAGAKSRPNIVVIVSDDLGYADLPAFGRSEIPVPHLDRLARSGAVFSQAYSVAPICVPSRMGILTGRYPHRFGIYDNLYLRNELQGFFRESLLPQFLQGAGYRTALVGKWHLSGNNVPWTGPTAEQRGFDEWVGIAGGMSNFTPPVTLYRNREPFAAPEYLTDFFGKEAVRVVRENHTRPFFLYLAFNAPHNPLDAMKADEEGLPAGLSPERRTYGGMVRALDRNVGRVLTALKESGVERNTLVVFINDNGGGGNRTGPGSRNTGRNVPLRGYKFDVFEGGIRVPMILSWPGNIRPNTRFAGVVSSMDLAPTILRSADIPLPTERPFDGVDLLPFLNRERSGEPHRVLCWDQRAWLGPVGAGRPAPGKYNQAVRKGKWKLVRLYGQEWQLFDLVQDIGEQHDLAREYPAIVGDLETEYASWRAQMPEPASEVKS